ncbi:MAG: hypothetical protein ACXIUV_03920 [Alkalilacustris sp.]
MSKPDPARYRIANWSAQPAAAVDAFCTAVLKRAGAMLPERDLPAEISQSYR